MGTRPTLVPNPTRISRKAGHNNAGGICGAAATNPTQVKGSKPATRNPQQRMRNPSNANTAPSVVSKTYFQAASNASGVSSKPTRKAESKVVNSTATHINATFARIGTASIDSMNRL